VRGGPDDAPPEFRVAVIAISPGDRRLLFHVAVKTFAVDPDVCPFAGWQWPFEQRVFEFSRGYRKRCRLRRGRTGRWRLRIRRAAGDACHTNTEHERDAANQCLPHRRISCVATPETRR